LKLNNKLNYLYLPSKDNERKFVMKYLYLKFRLKEKYCLVIAALFFLNQSYLSAREATILDKQHYSNVFGEIRNYRIFLPPAYEENSKQRFPVIYYYHGWSQRYFGSISSFQADEGESNEGDNIANFVAENEVIVVKPDGYNRRPDEPYYLRPYNIGPVETYRQFPLYFPELVKHIDKNFRTIADREHRAISGLSMGGFMTFWIAGKYPQLVSAAGNFCGSTEFVVGPKNFPVEYRHQEMYKNYGGINVRLNFGNEDFIRAYHRNMNKIWTQVLDNYEYEIYDAGHSTAGLGEMFGFLMKTFDNPPEKPSKWDHIDVYPAFSVWDYEVETDRNVPGFTVLENVDERGFRSSVRSFLPDGELMPFVKLSVTTSPVYEKNQNYQVIDIEPEKERTTIRNIKSDEDGRLKIILNGDLHEIGISKKGEDANISIASWEIKNRNWATQNNEAVLSVKLLNKGAGGSGKLTAVLEPFKQSAVVKNKESVIENIKPGKVKVAPVEFTFLVKDQVEMERLKLTIKDGNGNEWTDFIDIPIKADSPEIKDFVIADGKEFEVAAAGDDTISVFLGKGNGDGIANPGESVVVLINDSGRLHRALLYTSDPFINPAGIHIRESDSWGSYDHVGASAKYSVPVINSEVPQGHNVKFFAEYWLPDYPDHIIKRGVINIGVEGTDQTPPELKWVKVYGDNTIHAKLHDGGKIASVKAKFSLSDSTPDMAGNPKESFEVDLYDKGDQGDRTGSDNVFGRKIEELGFGLYSVVIEAEDVYGNKMVKEWPEILQVH
jgi:predicted alpha/beta superfamily hydrolase